MEEAWPGKGQEAGPGLVWWRKGRGPGGHRKGPEWSEWEAVGTEVTGKSFIALWAVGRALRDMGAKEGVPGSIWLRPSSECQLR